MNPPKKKPSPPPVYRPQPIPKVLQAKTAGSSQLEKPQLKHVPVAPPVYRPQPVPRVLQSKMPGGVQPPTGQSSGRPAAPPLLRPEPKVLQPKLALPVPGVSKASPFESRTIQLAARGRKGASGSGKGIASTLYRWNGENWKEKGTANGDDSGHTEQQAYNLLAPGQKTGWIGFEQNAAPCTALCMPFFTRESQGGANAPSFVFHVTADVGSYASEHGGRAAPFGIYITGGNVSYEAPEGAPPLP